MENTVKMRDVSQDEVDSLTFQLFTKIMSENTDYSRVIGIANGGLNISIPLAKQLFLPHYSIKISFYKGDDKFASSVPVVDMNGVSFVEGETVLFIDDLLDSGSTLRYIKQHLNVCHKFGCLYYNKHGKYSSFEPDFYVAEKNEWLIFPWEMSKQ